MSNNFNIDDFERLIKDRSDEFKMYPSKKVWYSIYNNIHPGKKWPSIATCISLISTLLLIGFLNTNSDNKTFEISSNQSLLTNKDIAPSTLLFSNFSTPFLEITPSKATSFLNLFEDKNAQFFYLSPISNNNKAIIIASKSISNNYLTTTPNYKNITLKNTGSKEVISQNTNPLIISDLYSTASKLSNILSEFKAANNNLHSIFKKDIELIALKNSLNNNSNGLSLIRIPNEENVKNGEINENGILTIFNNKIDTVKQNEINTKKITKEIRLLSDVEKAWVENYAMHNRPIPKNWRGKLGWQIYITPSIVYRTLKNTMPNELDINNSIIQKPSLGLEIGGGIISTIFKGVKVKTGLQLNFTRYNAEAYENSHPVATSITVHTTSGQSFQESRSTPYSNIDGISPVKLHNETFQISIPMGMDVKLVQFNNLQWSIGATIQPSYIIGGKSYLISSDKRNYIKETSLLNKWNLDAGFETFISYKTNGFTLQFGPQFRKQLFTTNNKNYFIQEYLTNYGFKFGISKLIK